MERTEANSAATMPMALLSLPDESPAQDAGQSHAGLLDFSSFLGRLGRPRAARPGESRLRDALVEARRNDRVCPRQPAWLRSCLGESQCQRSRASAAPALTALSAQPEPASLLERRKMLGQQLAWAARNGLIDEAYNYLHHLQENQWLHFAD